MATTSLLQFSQLIIVRSWRVLFLAMLLLLHIAAMRGAEDFWARGLMLAHFGLFIMWQPFMRGEERLSPSQTVFIVAIALGILYFLNWCGAARPQTPGTRCSEAWDRADDFAFALGWNA